MKHAIARGSLSNYLKIVARIIIGLVTFRLLYGALDQSSFGLYQLLWATVGYVVLLDFGFGFAAKIGCAFCYRNLLRRRLRALRHRRLRHCRLRRWLAMTSVVSSLRCLQYRAW